MNAQTFKLTITAPSDEDRDEIDAEQVTRWLTEHRPRHNITVERLS